MKGIVLPALLIFIFSCSGYVGDLLFIDAGDTQEEIISWVAQNIEYKADEGFSDYWQTPAETIERGTGDCEDFAVLAAALLVERGYRARSISYRRGSRFHVIVECEGVFYEPQTGNEVEKPSGIIIYL